MHGPYIVVYLVAALVVSLSPKIDVFHISQLDKKSAKNFIIDHTFSVFFVFVLRFRDTLSQYTKIYRLRGLPFITGGGVLEDFSAKHRFFHGPQNFQKNIHSPRK